KNVMRPPYMTLKQYILLRNDLKEFSKGALIAQACHAVSYATTSFISHPDTVAYIEDIKNMRKVILKIRETDIQEICSVFIENEVDFVVWVEMPEDIMTCVATRPIDLDLFPSVLVYLQKYKLF
ncbi:hypothetical protein PAEPH01_2647, partial [Pancytospora epiphaga]